MRRFLSLTLFLMFNIALFAQDYSVNTLPVQLLKKNAEAIIRLEKTEIELQDIDRMRIRIERVITVFEKSGDGLATMYMHYDKSTKIKDYEAKIYGANGVTKKILKKKDFLDISAVDGGTLYSDNRIIVSNYTPPTYPYTIHYSYTYETKNTLFIPDWQPIKGYDVAIEKSEYRLTNSSGIKIRTKEKNFENYNVKKEETPNIFSYSLSTVPITYYEPYSPSLDELTPVVLISPSKFHLEGHEGSFTNWEEFGKWMYKDLLVGRQQLPQEEINNVKQMVDGIEAPEERVKVLYQYMQEKTRYINTPIGIGGWQPYPAEKVSATGYGDCKALSNYMVSLLKTAGIDAVYTVINSNDETKEDIEKDFASMQGNHIILQVPMENDTIWLECTSQRTAFNHLGTTTYDRYALAVTPQGGKIIRTQTYPPEKNKETLIVKGKIDTQNKLTLTVNDRTEGLQYDWNYYLDFFDQEELDKWVKRKYNELKNVEISQFEFENNRDQAYVTHTAQLTAPNFAQQTGNNLIFNLLPIGIYETTLQKDGKRTHPLDIPFGFNDKVKIELTLPDGYQLNYNLESINIQSEFGTYSLQSKMEGNLLTVEREVKTLPGKFTKERYNDYVKFRRKIEKADKTKVLLEKN